MSFGVGKVGNVFPIVLYLVAALVTVANMTRFVYEERTNAGVMKALGYTERDVTKQFCYFRSLFRWNRVIPWSASWDVWNSICFVFIADGKYDYAYSGT